ncbi:hypothetical protein SDC9_166327 [bioreactor metagenome]|uniref:Uncharacterized protein n=1 Tax=bioreactor metagenome TaxID=1076179 RepID=A0A645FZ28_9ZZZZ
MNSTKIVARLIESFNRQQPLAIHHRHLLADLTGVIITNSADGK